MGEEAPSSNYVCYHFPKYLLILFKNSPWSQTHPIEHAKYLLQPGAPFPRFAVLDIALPTSF